MNNEKVKFLLNWNHFGEHLSSCMTKLMTDSSYSDIIIATSDKRMIYSHRFVLANSSKYFQRLLKHISTQRGIQLVVALPEIKYEIFKILMNYMYKGETQVPHELLPSVIKAGQFLEINGLVNLNENESSGNGEISLKYFSQDFPKCLTIYSSGSKNDGKQLKKIPSTLRDNVQPRESSHGSPINVLPAGKAKRQSVKPSDDPPKSTVEENGKENRSKPTKAVKCRNLSREKKDTVEVPAKRKLLIKQTVHKISQSPSPSSSMSIESGSPKKTQKRHSVGHEVYNVKIKQESEYSKSPIQKNEAQGAEEKITIKMEVPDDIEDEEYNELQCEICHDVYMNPSDWVKHMTEQHSDKGYQTFKDSEKSAGGSPIFTCVVCSSVCFSEAEWARHLRVWHTEKELALANFTGFGESSDKPTKKSELDKKK